MTQSKKAQKAAAKRKVVLAQLKIQKHVCKILRVDRKNLKAKAAISLYLEYYEIETCLLREDWIKQEFDNPESPLSRVKFPKTHKPSKLKEEEENGFYDSEAWQLLRRRTLRLYGCVCMQCGVKNTEIHVDHIKPRSKYPELELDENNLQVLCKKHNLEKSNLNEIDYRTSKQKALLK